MSAYALFHLVPLGRAGTGLFHKPKRLKMPQVTPRSSNLNAHGLSIFAGFCPAAGGKPLPTLPLRLAQSLQSVHAKSLRCALASQGVYCLSKSCGFTLLNRVPFGKFNRVNTCPP
jgi:hypothetical protein